MPRSRGAFVFLGEIGWREFAHHLLWHFPDSPEQALRPEYRDFPWLRDDATLQAWRQGRTGYPIVDAGMRQLAHTGWMHNRARMIVASFLVKQLLQPWTEGASWFWDKLVDADLANNTLGWQWSAGCGADAAPYFRIFNPVLQGGKFDPAGDYVRRWVPELAGLPAATLHRPWEAEPRELALAGVVLGRDYPRPIVTLGEGRARALRALAEWRQARTAPAGGRN
jgi:deoxyribodipyrimidine photo-lyase